MIAVEVKKDRLTRVLNPGRRLLNFTIYRYGLDGYTAMPYILAVLFIETSTFTKLLPSYLTDEEYRGLQTYLLQKPDAGDLIKGSGGVRKVRWAPAGSGKSGGIRAIYYWKKSDREVMDADFVQ